MNAPTIGWTNFARKQHTAASGNSYTDLSEDRVVQLVQENWDRRIPGSGEQTADRKALVPVPVEGFHCPPRAKLVDGLPVRAEVVRRQDGEEPYVETFVTLDDARRFNALEERNPGTVNIVVYSADALTENDGERDTNCDWEIVCVLCEEQGVAPMPPLVMARNFLEEAGGTKTDYTAREFAEAIWYNSTRKGVKVRESS